MISTKYAYLILLYTLLLSTSCDDTKSNKSVKNNTDQISDDDVSKEKGNCEFYIAQKYISKLDTIDLNFEDSLTRYFQTDSNSVTHVRHNHRNDSVDVLKLIEGVLRLPISENIEYSIHFDKSPWGRNDVIKYEIHFLDKNKYSSAYLTFRKYTNDRFCRKVVGITSKFTKKNEEVSLKYDELTK